jgi:hypothetical protein
MYSRFALFPARNLRCSATLWARNRELPVCADRSLHMHSCGYLRGKWRSRPRLPVGRHSEIIVVMRIHFQRFGSYDDPNAEWPPEILKCRSYRKLTNGGYQFQMTDGRIRTIPPGDFDIAEILPDGTTRPLS